MILSQTCRTSCSDTIELWIKAWNTSNALNTGFPLRKQNGAHPGSPKPAQTATAFGAEVLYENFLVDKEQQIHVNNCPRSNRKYGYVIEPATASAARPCAAYWAHVGTSCIKLWSEWISMDIFSPVVRTDVVMWKCKLALRDRNKNADKRRIK